jgi:RNA polymerase sigma-70 factor (ECF subfamily)
MDKSLNYSIVHKAKSGDINSFEKLVKKYQKLIRFFVYGFFGNLDIADDLSQEIFIKVFKRLKKLRDVSNFKKWLFKIAKNTCIDYCRRSKTNKNLLKFDESFIVCDERNEDNIILKDCIRTSLLELSPDERKAIILVSLIGLSYKEASDILNCPVGTIATWVHRANKKLKNILSKENSEF